MLKTSRILTEDDARPIGRIVLYITLPATIITSFSSAVYDHWMLVSLLLGTVYAGLLLFTILFLSRKEEPKLRALYALNCSGLNLGNIAIPFLISANPSAVVYAGMFSTGDSFFALGGSYAAARMVLTKERKGHIRTILESFKSSPPFFSFIIMAAIIMTGFHVPDPITNTCRLIGGANTPLCMLFIGLSLNFSKGAVSLKTVARILMFRLAGSCILSAFTLLVFTNAPILMRQAIAVCVFSAIPNIALIFARKLDLDTASASLANTLSSIFAIPLMALMNYLSGTL